MILLIHYAEKHIFSVHNLLSVRVILSKTMLTVDATFAAAPQSTFYHCSPGPDASTPLQRWGTVSGSRMGCYQQPLHLRNPPHLLSTSHAICYLHVIVTSCYNSDHFYIIEAFLCPKGFRQLITPPAPEAPSPNCWSKVTPNFFFSSKDSFSIL